MKLLQNGIFVQQLGLKLSQNGIFLSLKWNILSAKRFEASANRFEASTKRFEAKEIQLFVETLWLMKKLNTVMIIFHCFFIIANLITNR
jgi:hypothetical protein